MPDYLVRLLTGCLAVWLVDQVLVKFGVGEPAARVIQILVIILAVLYIVFGWMLRFQ
ncbi:MAG TPA: hypothetical protein VFX97_16860 [Pyrinomonadaceae bacterium]|nr:hypothetical protein [Pyrinomonadaceae bacterium]